MQTASTFERFQIPGIVELEEENGLVKAVVKSRVCSGEVYFHGAHITRWQPEGKQPVLFLSPRAIFQQGKAIRGGVPLIFPWFGQRTANSVSSRTDGPAHGFARIAEWKMMSSKSDDSGVELVFELQAADVPERYGVDDFKCTYTIHFGETLGLSLEVTNLSETKMDFEEAFHSYFNVQDVHHTAVLGLAGLEYIDKTDDLIQKKQDAERLILDRETDRPYLESIADITVQEPQGRTILVKKTASNNTVIWNPWAESSAKMNDMAPDDWQKMICVEAANLGSTSVKLEVGESHTMACVISVTG